MRKLLTTFALPVGLLTIAASWSHSSLIVPHGTVITPISRVYRVYQSNPSNPNFALAANAVATDGTLSYYTWNELSRNIPAAVQAGLPAGFDYSPWVPDGALASGGRTDPTSAEYPRTYAGLDQVSAAWPTTAVTGGETIDISFLATAAHNPSVWDVWMTTPNWDAATPLRWSHMEFLGRPAVTFTGTHYDFNLTIPDDRTGNHVLWVAWQRDDPVGEVFFSTSDLMIQPANDECADATPAIIGANGEFDLAHATASATTASCESGNDPDLWFRYTADCAGTLRAATCATNGTTDTTVSIWSGTCGALTELACDDNGCGVHGVASAIVAAGTDYFVKVSAPAGGDTSFELQISYDNNTGSFTTTSLGCSTASIQAGGSPNIGGIVNFSMQGGTGLAQALMVGLTQTAVPVCAGCIVGTTADALAGDQYSLTIPCDSALIGFEWWTQGIDAFAVTGGCSLGGGIDFTLTDTIRTQVGN